MRPNHNTCFFSNEAVRTVDFCRKLECYTFETEIQNKTKSCSLPDLKGKPSKP